MGNNVGESADAKYILHQIQRLRRASVADTCFRQSCRKATGRRTICIGAVPTTRTLVSSSSGRGCAMVVTPGLGLKASPFILGRRGVLLGLTVGLGSTAAAAAVEPLTRRGTPQLTLGPFYPVRRPSGEDSDLTRIAGRTGVAKGTVIDLVGFVTDEAGHPVPGARIDTWQTNGLGAYHHPSDESGLPHDPNFQGGAIFSADGEGIYRIRTVIPQPYASRQRHIHFDIRRNNRRLMTQMFFPGEPNERDALFASLRTPELQAAVTASLTDDSAKTDIPLFRWNIALAGE